MEHVLLNDPLLGYMGNLKIGDVLDHVAIEQGDTRQKEDGAYDRQLGVVDQDGAEHLAHRLRKQRGEEDEVTIKTQACPIDGTVVDVLLARIEVAEDRDDHAVKHQGQQRGDVHHPEETAHAVPTCREKYFFK